MANKPGFSHPCFQNEPARVARIHLPVAARCNIKCSFCNPAQSACVHGCLPGLTRQVLTPQQAVERVRDVKERQHIPIQIVGIAGPGEPLYNEATFETLERLRKEWPELHMCLSTNGLLLPDYARRLVDCGVETLTVTVNSITTPVARKAYEHVEGKRTDEAFERLIRRQLEGISMAAGLGLCVKVNSVLLPGENEAELPAIAKAAAERGALLHNVLPLIPRPDAQNRAAPTAETVQRVRRACGQHLCQFERCRHCRADAIIDATETEREGEPICSNSPAESFFQPTTRKQ